MLELSKQCKKSKAAWLSLTFLTSRARVPSRSSSIRSDFDRDLGRDMGRVRDMDRDMGRVRDMDMDRDRDMDGGRDRESGRSRKWPPLHSFCNMKYHK